MVAMLLRADLAACWGLADGMVALPTVSVDCLCQLPGEAECGAMVPVPPTSNPECLSKPLYHNSTVHCQGDAAAPVLQSAAEQEPPHTDSAPPPPAFPTCPGNPDTNCVPSYQWLQLYQNDAQFPSLACGDFKNMMLGACGWFIWTILFWAAAVVLSKRRSAQTSASPTVSLLGEEQSLQ